VYAGRHASSLIVADREAQPSSLENDTLSPVESEVLVREFNVGAYFKHNADMDYDEVKYGTEREPRYTYYISEEKLQECPRITIEIGEEEVSAILDTGCELTLMNGNLYEKIKQRGNKYLELPTQNITLVSAFNDKGRRVKRQIFVPVKVGTACIDHVFLVSPQLQTSAILGVDFFINTSAIINFSESCVSFRVDAEITRQLFDVIKEDLYKISGNTTSDNTERDVYRVSPVPLKTSVLPPRELITGGKNNAVASETSIILDKDARTGCREIYAKCSEGTGHSIGYDKVSRSLKARDDIVAADYDRSIERESGVPVFSIAKGNEGHRDGKSIRKHDSEVADTIVIVTPETPVNCFRTTTGDANHTIGATNDTPNGKIITPNELKAKVNEYKDLSENQREQLLAVLMKYQPQFTKRPRRYHGFEYQFIIEGKLPKSASSRTIPFALRDEVRAQIHDMLIEGILEESYSDYVNPLTIVLREHKPLRICVDARSVNRQMTPDRVNVAPMRELLQRFHGSRYITTLDLSSTFLQVPLAKSSRKWTAFNFENQVYQFTRVPYGYKNSLSAFIRALQKVLGDEKNVITYVDDIVLHSSGFDDHLATLESVLCKLTSAGFTINASKCHFCRPEIKFLGYIICDRTLRPDPRRIQAILSYPPPKNQKQLRKFLGICNFHHQFIVNYSQYIAPLLTLLRKGSKWSWSSEMQKAFEELREKFAHSIYLVQPDDSQDYIINTDASVKAIGAVLMQRNKEGLVNIVSTASRVITPAEQRYTTCELELMAIVYALRKFRVYIYGHKVTLNTDHKSLIFLKKCVVTSNRVARWLLEVEQWELEIRHIKGVDNTLADVLSCNPPHYNTPNSTNLRRHNQIMVHAIELNIDNSVKRELKNLAVLQNTDPRLKTIMGELTAYSPTIGKKYLVKKDVLYCKGDKEGQSWKAMLPECLEQKVMKFVHTSLGHLGSDKCYAQIKDAFHFRNLGRKLRKFIAACDLCQRTKHLNRAYDVVEKHHLPKRPGELCAVDLYGSLPTSRGNVRYIFCMLRRVF
jgi:hypothetical protein